MLGTCFSVPEEEIIKQFDEGDGIYFISKGDCVINLICNRGIEHVAIRLLTEGDHFGEIPFLYGCLRTSTIVSRNYNTLAKIIYPRVRMLTNEYPAFKDILINHVFKYNDPNIRFRKKLIYKLPYTIFLSKKTEYEILYALKSQIYHKGAII